MSVAQAAANRRGIVCMAGAMACFVVNDAIVKVASAALPMAQVILLRSLMVAVIVLAAARATGATARLHKAANPRVLLRAVFDAGATIMYMSALVHLPLANATAINLAAPLIMALLAVLFLNEQVGRDRWLAILAGFAGVLLIIQPRAQGFNAWALLTLAATFLHALRDLITRRIDHDIASILITFAAAVAACLMSATWNLVGGRWLALGPLQAGLVLCAALFVAGGFFLMVASMRQGDMSVVGPFRYSGLLVALVLGYAIWEDVPNMLAWCGIALMTAAGLWVLHDERARRHNIPAPD